MADLIRTLEADLFGAYEWAVDFYEDLVDLPEAPDRLAVHRGLLRGYEALEGKADEAMRAAEGLVAAEEDLDDMEREVIGSLDAARDDLFANATVESAKAFVEQFETAWGVPAHKAALVSDAILAALAYSNVLASLQRATLKPEEAHALHRRAAELYMEVGAMLGFRIGTGSTEWKETSQSALFRASAAWRLAGDEVKARRANEMAGPPPEVGRR